MTLFELVYYLNLFFLFYMFLYSLVFFILTFFAALNLDDFFIRKEHMSFVDLKSDENYIPISILVPAYNEEITIKDSINSLLNLDYPEYEIVVINDGSTDGTADKLIDSFNLKKIARPIRKSVICKAEESIYENSQGIKIVLISKENGGKADALNMGINASRYPLYVCMDADSMLKKDALKKIIEPFLTNDETIAVGGNIKVSNHLLIKNGEVVKTSSPKKLLVIFQIIEYLRVFLTSRVSFNGINANLIISGAFGIYSKKAAINVGGYTPGVIGEDMEIIVKMHAFYRKNRLRYKMGYVADAICWTQVPESIKVLMSQRRRWFIGMGQSLYNHWFMMLNPRYGNVGTIAYTYFFIFEYMAPIIELIGIAVILLSFHLGIINASFMVIYIIIYIGFNSIVSSISVLLEKYMSGKHMSLEHTVKLLFFCLLESFGYRQLCSIFRLIATVSFKKKSWGNMVRTQNMKEDNEELAV